MRVPILMPDLGVPRATLSIWFVEQGDTVDEGDRLLEILTGPATFDISAPTTGKLVERCAFVNDHLQPGQALGYIEET
jgi:pyruvate/2-oxoglutarate dehydrogenase complex dihydrolipoamide acyltransferase (E2) component